MLICTPEQSEGACTLFGHTCCIPAKSNHSYLESRKHQYNLDVKVDVAIRKYKEVQYVWVVMPLVMPRIFTLKYLTQDCVVLC